MKKTSKHIVEKVVSSILCLFLFTSCAANASGNSSGGGGTTSSNPPAGETKFTVTWLNYDGTVLEIDRDVNYGTLPAYNGKTPTKEKDEQSHYVFSGWSPEVSVVLNDVTYTAQFTSALNAFTVTWLNYDGTTLDVDRDVQYGSLPRYKGNTPFKQSNEQYDYVFSGWSPEISAVTNDVTYTALFTEELRSYRVVWLNYDGTTLKTDMVPYGSVPQYGDENPTRGKDAEYTYTFSGWSPAITEVRGEATYTATYSTEVNEYTITWLNHDGTTLKTDSVPYGSVPRYNGKTPIKEKDEQYTYTFVGWYPEVTSVTENATYTALFTDNVNTYTVTWLNYDGTVLKVDEEVPYGSLPSHAGEAPTKPSDDCYDYAFVGWETEVVPVTGDVSYTAAFTTSKIVYTIEYELNGGTNNPNNPVNFTFDSDRTALLDPEREGYGFLGWKHNNEPVTEIDPDWRNNVVLVASWETVDYAITYVLDGGTNNPNNPASFTVESEAIALLDPSKEGYKFFGWYKEASFINEVTAIESGSVGDITLYAKFKKICNITFDVGLGKLDVDSMEAYVGEDYALPTPTVPEGYLFDHWSINGQEIVESGVWSIEDDNVTITANYKLRDFTLTLSSDGSYYTVTAYIGTQEEVVIPESFAGIPITRLGIHSFSDSPTVKKVVVPDTITTIERGAFQSCSTLESLTLPFIGLIPTTGLQLGVIFGAGDYDTYGNRYVPSSLKEVIVSDQCTSIPYHAFYNCTDLVNVVLPAGITSVGNDAFYNCTSLAGSEYENAIYLGSEANPYLLLLKAKETTATTYVFHDDCRFVNCGAFEGCTSITSLILPFVGGSATSNGFIGYIFGAKNYDDNQNYVPISLKEIIVKEGVVRIGDRAFYDCKSITSISLPKGIASIGRNAFGGCTALSSINIPEGVTTIGSEAFRSCSSLLAIIIPDSVTSIGSSAFSNCSKLETAKLSSEIALIDEYTFYNCNALSSVNIPRGVKTIGRGAFYYCYALASIEIPEGVTTIGANALYQCTSLTSINLPEGVTTIGANAFYQCTSLASINIPSSVTTIGGAAFYQCSLLTSITIPEGVTSIGATAFAGLAKITSVVVPSSVTSIGKGAFQKCSSITSMTLPFIGESATANQFIGYVFGASGFSQNSSYVPSGLTELNVHGSCRSYGLNALYGCSQLKVLSLPLFGDWTIGLLFDNSYDTKNNLTTINVVGASSVADRAFSLCPSLTAVNISEDVASIDYAAFTNATSLKTINVDENNTKYCSVDGVLFSKGKTALVAVPYDYSTTFDIPSGVTYFYPTFASNTNITSITVPKGVKTICSLAFAGCTALKSVTLPEGLEIIGYSAFSGCTSLRSIVVPDSVTSIGAGAFEKCSSLTSMTVPFVGSSPTEDQYLGYFFGAPSYDSNRSYVPASLKELILSESCVSIGANALLNCPSVMTVTFHSGVTSIGTYAFYNNDRTNIIVDSVDDLMKMSGKAYIVGTLRLYDADGAEITEVTIPNEVTVVCDQAFYRCESLTSIFLHDNVTSIGASAFYGCSSLSSVNIPSNVESIGSYAFANCPALTSINVPSSVVSIDTRAFSGCTSLASVSLTSGLLSIGDGAFWNCALTTIGIPNTVTFIGSSAFSDCGSLESAFVSTAITSIGASTFSNCASLSSINIPEGVTSIGVSAFSGCASLTSIDVPDTVTSIGKGAFQGCYSLESIALPFVGSAASQNQFLGFVFGATDYSTNATYVPQSLHTVKIGNGCTSFSSSTFYGCAYIERVHFPDNVVAISSGAFSGCSNLRNTYISVSSIDQFLSINGKGQLVGTVHLLDDEGNEIRRVTVPNVASIPSYAFYNCAFIYEVTIPSSVTSIEDNAFVGCTNLVEVLNFSRLDIRPGYTTNGLVSYYAINVVNDENDLMAEQAGDFIVLNDGSEVYLVSYVGNDEEIAIPDNVTVIGSGIFSGMAFIKRVTIGNSVTSIGEYAFQNCVSLSSVTVPNNVTSIGKGAFKDCDSLTEMTLPFVGGSATENQFLGYIFGASSFSQNAAYQPQKQFDVTVSNGCTSIAVSAFQGCTNLRSVDLPASLTSIGQSSFKGCNYLNKMTLPFVGGSKTQNTFLGYLFGGSKWEDYSNPTPSSLKDVVIRSGCTSLGNGAFFYCKSIVSITIPDGVTSIGSQAFYNCSSLPSMVIPDTVTSFGNYIFEYCSALKSLTIPFIGPNQEYPSVMNSYYFGQSTCKALENLVITNACKSLNKGALAICTSLRSLTLPGVSASYLGYYFGAPDYYSNGSYVPSSLTSVTLTTFNTTSLTSFFYRCSSIKTITFPGTITSYTDYAFQYCDSLLDVYFKVDSISQFMSIKGKEYIGAPNIHLLDVNGEEITEVIIPNGTTTIPNYAFMKCVSVTSVVLPTTITAINQYSFSGCSCDISINVSSISQLFGIRGRAYLTNNVIHLLDASSGSEITEVVIPSEVTQIPAYAFFNCVNLTSVAIPNTVTYVGASAFKNCSSLESITLPDSVKTIGASAFENCTLFTSMVVPNGVTSVGSGAFIGCSSLESITLPFVGNTASQNQFLGYIFGATSYERNEASIPASLTTVILSEACETIADHAFYNCSSLTTVTLSNGLLSIGESAFQYCSSLLSMTVPGTVTSIADSAFADCTSIYWIIIPDSVASMGSYVFAGCDNLTIYCYAPSRPSGWSKSWNVMNCPVVWGYTGE